MTTPTWYAPVVNDTAIAGNVDQLLGTHAIDYLYQGTSQESDTSGGSGYVSPFNLNLAESFTTAIGQTTISRLELYLATFGAGTDVLLTIESDSAGLPSGTVIAGPVTIPLEFPSGAWLSIPMPVAGLSASTQYWIVISATGSAIDYIGWAKSGSVAGAATQVTGGPPWIAQTYGFNYNVFAGVVAGDVVRNVFEDGGDRWVGLDYSAGLLTTVRELVNPGLRSVRTVNYSGGIITGVS